MSRDVSVGTLVSQGPDATSGTEPPALSIAEVRRRAWLGLEHDELLGGRFRIQELIQSGGMGDVYRATDLLEQVDVAVKTLRAGGTGVRRFEREAQHLAELKHPGIPKYVAHDLKSEHGPYIVMEWLDGCTLADRLRQERVGVKSAILLIGRVAEAVAAAHEIGLIHRDINPSNIFLVGGRLDDVRVLDFGVARLTKEDLPLTAEGTQIGTPGYMAPEQVEGSAEVDKAADVFALGCVLYELVTGQRAFSAPTIRELLNRILTEQPPLPSDLNHLVQPELERLILRSLEKLSGLRPNDAEEFVMALRGLPDHEEVAEDSFRPSRPTISVQQVSSVIVLRGTDEGLLEKVRQVGKPFGLRVHRGTDSTIVASTQGRGTAGDHAVMAARCALSIQRATRVPTIAVSTGLFFQSGDVPFGRAFDSALVSLLLKDRGVDSTSGPALWLDENTASLLDSRFEVRQVEQGFLLRGLRETHEPSRTVLGRRTRCVGRKRELSMLQATLSESFEDGVASSVLITGSPGIGKTRLANELVRFARRERPKLEVLRGNGESLTSGSPLAVISQAIVRACHIKDDDSQSVRVRKLKQRLSRSVNSENLPRIAGFCAELLGIVTDEFESQELKAARRDAVLRGDQIHRALEDWLRAECKNGSVLMVFDDFQWGDLATVKMIDSLLRNLSEEPIVVVCLARPEVHELFPKLWVRRGVTELRLGGISRRAATQMIEEILGSDVAEAVSQRVIRRAQGNPFWIEELLRAEKSGQGEAVPDRVVLLAQSRIEQLSLLERRILEAGSVFGRRFSEPGLGAVLSTDYSITQVKGALRELVDAEILLLRDTRTQGTDQLYEFSSGLLRDAAYSLVDGDEREEAHCRAADYLERSGDGERLAIALHFSLGGALDRARPHYLAAAEQALSGDDMANAIACAEEALSCGAQGVEAARLHLIHAEASKWRGDHVTALAAARKATDLAQGEPSVWFRSIAEAAAAAGKLGQRALAFDLGSQLLKTDRDLDLDERCVALCRVATQISLMGNVSLASDLISAVEISPGTIEPAPRLLGFLDEARAVFAGASGDPMGRVVFAEASVEHFELAGDHRNACLLRLSQGFAEVEFGANQRAVSSLVEAVRIAERMGLENSIPVGQAQWGRALARLGQREEARKLLEQAAGTFERQKNVRLAGMCRIYLTELSLMEGDLQTAEGEAQRAVAIHETVPAMRRLGLALLAAIYAHQDRGAEALTQALQALEGLTPETRLPVGETLVRLCAAEGLVAGGENTRALQLLEAEQARLTQLDEEIRGSHLLGHGSTDLGEEFIKGCPERAFLMTLDKSTWAAAIRTSGYVSYLSDLKSDFSADAPNSDDTRADLFQVVQSQLERIRGMNQPIQAQLAMAQSYSALSREFALSVDQRNANYATISAWAALNSFEVLRNRELERFLNDELDGSSSSLNKISGIARLILHVFGLMKPVRAAALESIERASLVIELSRKKVYDEIAPLLARFVNLLDNDGSGEGLGELTSGLQLGSAETGGQELIKQAFEAWSEGHHTSSPTSKAQLILLGNSLMTLYEQTRLQRHIKLALDLPLQDVFADALRVRMLGLRTLLHGLVVRSTHNLIEDLKLKWERLASRYAMKLSVPDATLISLGDQRPVRPLEFPVDLRDLNETRLVAMCQRFDANFGLNQQSSSNNWSDLRDRMGYLIEIMRGRQQEPAMSDATLELAVQQALDQAPELVVEAQGAR